MRTAEWTYELATGGEGPAGIEEYAVETADGERVGTVAAVLRHDRDVYLAYGLGHHGPRQTLRALPWRHVAAVDGNEAAVRLAVSAAALDDESLDLDGGKAVEGGPADAVRLTELPPELGRYATPDELGPRDRPVTVFLPALAVGGVVCIIVAIGLGARGMTAGAIALALVGAVAVAVAALGLVGLLRDPYVRRRRPAGPKPSPPDR